MSSGQNPSPDPDDHLTLKKLKASHSQESKSQSHISVQTLTPVQPNLNTQPIPSQSVNTQPNLCQSTIPSTIPTSHLEVVDIEDSDEEQGLQGIQTNIFNEISSPPIQTTLRTMSEAGPSE